jgi:hypothetical protein
LQQQHKASGVDETETTMQAAAAQNLSSATPRFRNILVVIKQTAFEEYTQVSKNRPTHTTAGRDRRVKGSAIPSGQVMGSTL